MGHKVSVMSQSDQDHENYWCDITKKSSNGSWLFDQEIRGLSNEPADSLFNNDYE